MLRRHPHHPARAQTPRRPRRPRQSRMGPRGLGRTPRRRVRPNLRRGACLGDPLTIHPHNADGRWHWIDAPRPAAVAAGLPPNTPMVQLVHGGEADRGNAAPTSFPAPVALADLRKFRVDPVIISTTRQRGGTRGGDGGRAPRGRLAGRGGGGTAAAAAARRVGSGASAHTGRGR